MRDIFVELPDMPPISCFPISPFLELGCPRSWRPVSYPLTVAQTVGAQNLESEILSFIRCDKGFGSFAPAGGRARLFARLETLAASYDGSELNGQLSASALAVKTDRVALPAVAGTIDPGRVLPEPQTVVFEKWEEEVRLLPSEWPSPFPRYLHTRSLQKTSLSSFRFFVQDEWVTTDVRRSRRVTQSQEKFLPQAFFACLTRSTPIALSWIGGQLMPQSVSWDGCHSQPAVSLPICSYAPFRPCASARTIFEHIFTA